MGSPLKLMTVHGFKSIERLENFRVDNLNVLIGANGSGKSNFVQFFRLLRALADESLQSFVNEQGGGDGMLFLGAKRTPRISASLKFGQNVYRFVLEPTATGTLQVTEEEVLYTGGQAKPRPLSHGSLESALKSRQGEKSSYGHWPGVAHYVYTAVSSWTVYHFHDTSDLAPMRRDQSVRDWERFRHDASNLAAFLLALREREPNSYSMIRDTIRLIAPFFDDFLFRPLKRGLDEQVRLEWLQKGTDFPFQPNQLSDGTIRFICLATALLQPLPPSTIVIDEPELGLHPYAIAILSDLIKSASERTQVIVSTQSPLLLDHFSPEQVVVVTRRFGRSEFQRLDSTELDAWLEDYSVGELWQKNVVRGGPAVE